MKKIIFILSVMMGLIFTHPFYVRGEGELKKKVIILPPGQKGKRSPSNIAVNLLFGDQTVTIIPNFESSELFVTIVSEETGEEWIAHLTNGECVSPFDGEAGVYRLIIEFPEGGILTGSFEL